MKKLRFFLETMRAWEKRGGACFMRIRRMPLEEFFHFIIEHVIYSIAFSEISRVI